MRQSANPPELSALDVRAPCSGVTSASVIAAPGIVAVPISPVMGASLHAQPELTFAHGVARVHPARTWARTLLVPACWPAFQRPSCGDIDGERSVLGLAHVALISGRGGCMASAACWPACRCWTQCQSWDSGAPTFPTWKMDHSLQNLRCGILHSNIIQARYLGH